MKYIIPTFILCFMFNVAYADTPQVPYFASLKENEVNTRTGPSIKYPILWVYQKENWPVKITATFEGWKKVEDVNGEVGWIYSSLISSKRFVVVRSEGAQEVLKNPITTSQIKFIVERNVVAKLDYCKNSWCQIEVNDMSGWIPKSLLWGVD